MIKLVKVNKNFGNNNVLHDISLEIDKNEIVAILGASGSGKSTFLRCINRLEEPSSGEIYIGDQKVTVKNKMLVCQKVAMVFQNFNLFPHFTVLENLIYAPMQVNKLSLNQAQEKAMNLLQRVGLEDKINTKPSELSGGQKQRVAIARALMMDPEIILFDEPTSALDLEIIKDLINLIKSLKELDITMLIVTHHVGFAKQVATKVIFMEQGHISDYIESKAFFNSAGSERSRAFLENIKEIE